MWEPKYLKYNLDEEKLSKPEKLNDPVVKMFLGGRGIGTYLAYNLIPTDCSPMGVDNSIILGTGPLTGNSVPSSGMTSATFKSPQTHTLTTCTLTGDLGTILTNLGFDFFVIQGRAKTKSIIVIDDFGDVRLESASKFWEKNITESHIYVKKKYGTDTNSLLIGRAAVNGVIFSSISYNTIHSFQRSGLGTIFASKNIKGIIFRLNPTLKSVNSEMKKNILDLNRTLRNNLWSQQLKDRGMISIYSSIMKSNSLPTKNCTKKLNISDSAILEFGKNQNRYQCSYCPVKCIKNSYHNFHALGFNLLINDMDEVNKIVKTVENEGLDPISLGSTLASILHIQDSYRKLLDEQVPGRWGDKLIFSLINDLVNKRGLGDKIGRGEQYLYNLTGSNSPFIKSQSPGMLYYPNLIGTALSASVTSSSGDIMQSNIMFGPEILGYPYKMNPKSLRNKASMTVIMEDILAFFNSLVLCDRFLFSLFSVRKLFDLILPIWRGRFTKLTNKLILNDRMLKLDILPQLLESSCNIKISSKDILEIGERITILERLFNTRSGNPKIDDTYLNFLPKRSDFFMKHKKLLEIYYRKKGLTSKGLVKKEKLKDLGLIGLIHI